MPSHRSQESRRANSTNGSLVFAAVRISTDAHATIHFCLPTKYIIIIIMMIDD